MSSSSPTSAGTSPVFELGEHPVSVFRVEKEGGGRRSSLPPSPPKPLLISTPADAGEFPVMVLVHGYLLCNSFYTQLMRHIASHGFVVVAPQLYTCAGPDSDPEVKSLAAILSWLPSGLPEVLPRPATADLARLALSGHSRGGKTVFSLALRDSALAAKASALIAIDPVDGMDRGKQTNPPVLTYTPLSFNLGMPVMVIGTGLGEIKRNPLFPPCAPPGVNHRDFFAECQPPACHLVARDFGHLDMLDDETAGLRGKLTYCLCKNGPVRGPMRSFVGGSAVAFLKAHLQGDDGDLMELKEKPDVAPVFLSVVTFI